MAVETKSRIRSRILRLVLPPPYVCRHFLPMRLILRFLISKKSVLFVNDAAPYGCIGEMELHITFVKPDNEDLISILHLAIQGSSGWVACRHIIRSCTIEQIGGNALILRSESGDCISIIDAALHRYLSTKRLVKCEQQSSPGLLCLSAASSAMDLETFDNWTKLRRVADRVQKHTWGHASHSDMQTLLSRSDLCNENVKSYLA